ncbi:MAG: DsbA family protein [Bacteroidia bacterium]
MSFKIAIALLLPFIFLTASFNNPMQKPKIIYVFDPMCGWCFGFSKVIEDLEKNYKSEFEFEIISGGMVIGDREGPIGDFADYILGVYKRLEETCSVSFGQPYLNQLKSKNLWSGSTKPTIAIEAFKLFEPDKAIAFAKLVQHAYFVDGKDLRDENVYVEIASNFNVNKQEYIKALNSEDMRKAANDGFQLSANFGVTSYPCVILVWKEKYYMVAKGYTPYNNLVETVNKVKNTY